MTQIRTARAEAAHDLLNDEIAALVKGMLLRGDKQSDIAACFGLNGGRPSEINSGKTYAHVKPAPPDALPPAGPYPTPYQLWQMRQGIWRSRIALENAADAIQQAMVAVHKVEQR